MDGDRDSWNRKFGKRRGGPLSAEPFITGAMSSVEPCRCLDIACGDGRNALALAAMGFEVTGVDISDVGLGRLATAATEHAVVVETAVIDLDVAGCLRGLETFGAAIVSHYKPPASLWLALPEHLDQDAVVVLCTFNTLEHDRTGFRRAFCLGERELENVHPELELISYERFVRDGRHLDGYRWRRR